MQEKSPEKQASELQKDWETNPRWKGIRRDYNPEDVVNISPSFLTHFDIGKTGAERLWEMLNTRSFVQALGAETGQQAVAYVKAGLPAIYMSGWQVAADANLSGETYPDQSLYPSNSGPALVKRINSAFMRAESVDQVEGKKDIYYYAPIMADLEAGFGGQLNVHEYTRDYILAGASGIHLEDQDSTHKKCGHLGGKVLVPTTSFILKLKSARLAADKMSSNLLIMARTDSLGAKFITNIEDPLDKNFVTGETEKVKVATEGGETGEEVLYKFKGGIEAAISRGLNFAPFSDMLWFETSKPDLKEATVFANAIHQQFPNKFLAYNCSPSFNWKGNLTDQRIRSFQSELGKLGYKFQFITLAGWHTINLYSFALAQDYLKRGITAYADLQQIEKEAEKLGYTGMKHQREVGTRYFDRITEIVTGGQSSTTALKGSTEEEQFKH